MLFSRFKDYGTLGNNRRIRNFILTHNKRSDYPLVDDKIKTAELLTQRSIPHPKTIDIISSISGTKSLHPKLKSLQPFAVKPAKGATGNGIAIVNSVDWSEDKKKTYLVTNRKDALRYDDFVYYLSMILSGVFSLSGQKDRVLIQEKLKIHPFFDPISYKGIPDVRVITFLGFPVMAMVRLPTKVSGGRGNLHQGAVGCGIDLATGKINSVIQNNRLISYHPDYPGTELRGLVIPSWDDVLDVATQCTELTRIGYLGVDIVIDPDRGPLVLEMNARPGLSIQLANQKGLLGPLEKILALSAVDMKRNERIEFSRRHF